VFQQRTSIIVIVALTAVSMAALSGCGGVGSSDEKTTAEKSFGFSGKTLKIKADTTDLRVENGGNGKVEVAAELTGKAGDKGNATMNLDGDTLTLKVKCSGVSIKCESLHVVKVPDSVALTVTSASGSARFVGLKSDVDADIRDGWVKVENPAGRLQVEASENVTVTGAKSSDVDVESTDHDVKLTFLSDPQKVRAVAAGNSVKIGLPAGSATYRLNLTGSGEVKGGLVDDPHSDRSITAVAHDGSVDVSKAA
jgi:hypothetical protein